MEKRKYQLIAFDMDGTLLNKHNKVSELTAEAIKEASEAGKSVVISTGRSFSEVKPYMDQLQNVRYAIMESGALVYDFKEEKILKRVTFSPETLKQLEEVSHHEEMFLQCMSDGKSLIDQGFVDWLSAMSVNNFREFVDLCETIVEDVRAEMLAAPESFEKVNFYHLSALTLQRTMERVKGIDAEAALSAAVSLEMSPPGISKGTALKELAGQIGIPVEETIAVGDSDNDRTMLETAGLAVAMGNADESLKAIADAVVASHNEDGCAEAIRRFLLS